MCGVLLIVLSAMSVLADDAPPELHGFIDRTFSDETGEHRYVVFVPHGQPPESGWPVILFLHGAGERGSDGRRQLDAGLGPLVKLRAETFPALVVFPQAEGLSGPILQTWSANSPDGCRAMAILDEVEALYPTDPARRVLTGWSMGGYGSWRLAAAYPEKWSAVVPVAGGGNSAIASQLTNINVWAFHGTQDHLVPVSEGRTMATAVREAGGRIAYSEINDVGHDVWRRVYDSDVVLNWMLSPDHELPDLDAFTLPEDRTHEDAETTAQPFDPVMIVENAMALRLGVDAMQTVAHGIPALVAERGGLTGELADVTDQFEMDDRTFDVRFGGLTFEALLAQAILRPRGADRLRTELAMRNVTLRIDHIEVTDGEVGFQAGPAEIVIGHREPVWLRVEVRPAVVDQQLSFKLLRSSFKIPDNNWYVSSPESITLQGDWLNEREVETAVVGGVYLRKETIEEQFLSAVPSLLDRLATEVSYEPLAQMVHALWPLPVYQPHLQVHPESISTDTAGVSLTLGVTVAGFENTRTPPVGTVRASAPPAYEIDRTTDLRAGVAVDVIDHLSSLIAGTSAAQIYASDIPGRPFQELTDLTTLSHAIPGLDRFMTESEVWAALRLEDPLHLQPGDGSIPNASGQTGLSIEVPRMSLALSVNPAPSTPTDATTPRSPPQHVLDASVHVRQPVTLALSPTENGDPGLSIAWGTQTQTSATVQPPETDTTLPPAVDESELARLFEQGWRRWTASQTQQVVDVPTMAVGQTKLTLRRMDWTGMCLSARFLPAATTLRNASEEAITFHVRGPDSRWSKARTLAPGAVSTYETGTQLTLRADRDWQFDRIELPPGTSWEWRRTTNSRGASWAQVAPATAHPATVTDAGHSQSTGL